MSKFLKFILKYIAILTPPVAVLGFIVFSYYYHDLPSVEEMSSKNEKRIIEVKYSNNSKITTIGDSYDNQITYNEIPQNLINAVIATEDRKFFKHHGFDIFGISRAFYANFKKGRVVQGGSTITQQLVKLLYFDSSRTMKRKIQELLLAIKLERIFSKEQILTLYLNRAYFGAGNYGVSSASKHYFNKKTSNLDLNQAAMLAGLLKAPSKLAPTRNRELAEIRANQVLANMLNAGYLNEDNLNVFGEDIDYKTDRSQRLYFADYATENFDYYLSNNQKTKKFFSLQTTLDQKIHNITEDVIDEYAINYKNKLQNSQIAAIVMSKDGAIKSMIGGKNYQKSQFNRAVHSNRQPGSIFKTFIYLQAIAQGYEIDDIVEDKIINIRNWQPENYHGKYHGKVTLKESFAKSMNSVSVQLFQKINKDQLIKTTRKMGVFSKIDKHDPTTSLGTMQVSLLELVTAFSVISNNGKGVLPYQITKISDTNNITLYKRSSSGLGQVIDEENIHKLKKILRETIKNGTGKRANVANDIYGKTGTTQNSQDAWFIGFNSKYTIGIWIGNDDNSPTKNITGGSLPAQIFADIIKKI
jgi:penicillin-binding protein 1A